MKYGLPQGYVRFGTVPHRVLLHLHEVKTPQSYDQICLALDLHKNFVTTALCRLLEFKFIFRHKQRRDPEAVAQKAAWTYSLDKARWLRRHERVMPKMPSNVRSDRWRKRRACTVPKSTTPYASSIEQVAKNVVVMATISRIEKAAEPVNTAPEPTTTTPSVKEPAAKTLWPSYRRPKSSTCSQSRSES